MKQELMNINKSFNVFFVGPAGSGKTTIMKELKNIIPENTKLYMEEEKYYFLEKYYNNKKKWSLITQIDFLTLRNRTLSEASKNKKINILDRVYIDDYFYAKFNYKNKFMTKKEFKFYKKIFLNISEHLKEEKISLDILFIFQLGKDVLINRIKERDRMNEVHQSHLFDEIYDIYHKDINGYIKFMKNQNMRKIIIIKNEDEPIKVARHIWKEIQKNFELSRKEIKND